MSSNINNTADGIGIVSSAISQLLVFVEVTEDEMNASFYW